MLRWTPVVAIVVATFFLVGFVASGQFTGALIDFDWFGRFVGAWIMFLALVVIAVAGVVAAVRSYRTRS